MTKVVLVSAVALIDADGRVLLAQRPEGKPMAGLWEFPGGKVEPGESPEAALGRARISYGIIRCRRPTYLSFRSFGIGCNHV